MQSAIQSARGAARNFPSIPYPSQLAGASERFPLRGPRGPRPVRLDVSPTHPCTLVGHRTSGFDF